MPAHRRIARRLAPALAAATLVLSACSYGAPGGGTASAAPSSAPVTSTGAAGGYGGYGDYPATSVAPSAGSGGANPASIEISGFKFGSGTLAVKAGTTVTWTNRDGAAHTVTATDGSFSSANLSQGATFQHTFDAPGTYAYHCRIHGSMTAVVTVTA